MQGKVLGKGKGEFYCWAPECGGMGRGEKKGQIVSESQQSVKYFLKNISLKVQFTMGD